MGLPQWLRGSKIHLQFRRHNGFHPWAGKIPWRRAWPPLRDSCLENPVDRGAWRAAVPGVAKRHSWRLTRTHTILTHTQSKIFKWRILGTTWRSTNFHSFIILFRHRLCSCPHFVPWVYNDGITAGSSPGSDLHVPPNVGIKPPPCISSPTLTS